jgi:hypothetical protein
MKKQGKREREHGADAGRRLQHGQLDGDEAAGGVLDLGFEAADGGVERFEQARCVSTRRCTA